MEVRKIANIAKIYLNDAEIPALEKKLDDVYAWLDDIKKIDVSAHKPLFNVHEHTSTAVREIENPEFYSPSVALANTPVQSDNFILVPKVVER